MDLACQLHQALLLASVEKVAPTEGHPTDKVTDEQVICC